jgi:quercetin dioxygenase-like cupin family protein
MSGFTVVNLMDVEDRIAGRVPGLEGRFARTELDSRDLGVSYFRYAPGLRSGSGHRHKEQEEVYVVIAGGGRMLLDGALHDIRQWDLVRVAPEVMRAFEAGPEGLELLIVGGPKPEGGDGVMAEVAWPD